MTSRKLAVLVLVTTIFCRIKCDRLDEMNWEPGDILTCKLSGAPGFFGFDHYMIGSDIPHHVISVFNNGDDGRIEDIHHADFTDGINREKCRNWGKGSSSRQVTVERAKRFIGRRFTYSVLYCNCQHFTNYWANGYSGKWYNNQSLQPSAPWCPV